MRKEGLTFSPIKQLVRFTNTLRVRQGLSIKFVSIRCLVRINVPSVSLMTLWLRRSSTEKCPDLLVIRATRVLVAVAFGYPLFGISGEQIMALYESNTWSIGENINNK
jgi:hypothetical protein